MLASALFSNNKEFSGFLALKALKNGFMGWSVLFGTYHRQWFWPLFPNRGQVTKQRKPVKISDKSWRGVRDDLVSEP